MPKRNHRYSHPLGLPSDKMCNIITSTNQGNNVTTFKAILFTGEKLKAHFFPIIILCINNNELEVLTKLKLSFN